MPSCGHWPVSDNRVGLGTGVFGLAAPRAVEFGMRIMF